jgi:hypothetical protein
LAGVFSFSEEPGRETALSSIEQANRFLDAVVNYLESLP